MAAAWTSAPGACVLAGVAGVDQLQVGLAQPKGELISGQPELQADPRRENGAGRTDRTGLDEASLLDPAVPAPLKHADRVVTIIIERPPEPGRKLTARVVHRDHMGLVADPALCHGRGESLRGRDLRRYWVVEIDNVAGPVDIDRTRDVRSQVFPQRAPVVGVLDAWLQWASDHVATHVDNPDFGVIEAGAKPFGRDQKINRSGHRRVPGRFRGAFSLR